MRRFALLLLLATPLLAKDDSAKIKTVVDNRFKEWVAAENKRDAEGVTSLFDEEAVVLPKSEEAAVGKAAILDYYKKLFADPRFVPFTLTVEPSSFQAVSDVAIETANFEGDLTRNGTPVHFRGKFLIVWKKQSDGSWKIFRYMFDEIPAKK